MSGYRLTGDADADLFDLFVYGIEQFGLSKAQAYREALSTTFERITEYPRAVRVREEMPIPMRVHRHGSHMIVYKIESDDTVLIVRIRHSREDWLTNS